MSVPKTNYQGNFSTYMYGKCFGTFAKLEMIVGHRDIYYAKKIINYFGRVEDIIFVEKINTYESHILPRTLVQTC